ncbi:MAG: hypothetical protein E6Q25_04275 [Acinetobacter sp.]|jgi:uncharacterized protein|nr:MAG: hypothetical protein E6Q25_04275 [Acinetobacter sp.]
MSANIFSTQIEPFKCAEQGFSWSGQLPLSRFARVAHDAIGTIDNQWVQIDCKLSKDAYHRIVWLDARLSTEVALQCQRCLDTVAIPLISDVHIAIVDDESIVDCLDEDADFIVLGEDLGTQKGDFKTPATVDLIYILEDELLLSMPNSPKHDACEHKHRPAIQTDAEEKRENPFDILAGLKDKFRS